MDDRDRRVRRGATPVRFAIDLLLALGFALGALFLSMLLLGHH